MSSLPRTTGAAGAPARVATSTSEEQILRRIRGKGADLQTFPLRGRAWRPCADSRLRLVDEQRWSSTPGRLPGMRTDRAARNAGPADAPYGRRRARPGGRGLPLATGAGAAAVLLAGSAVAVDQRADREGERAQRAAAAAEARYGEDVSRASALLYDQLQPLQTAVERALDDEPFSGLVLSDVAGHLTTVDAARPARELLNASAVPRDRADEHTQLLQALDDVTAAVKLAAAVDDDAEQAPDEELFAALVDADVALDDATRAFATPLVSVLPSDPKPLQPDTFGGSFDGQQAPLSRASYLLAAGSVCGQSLTALLEELDGRTDDPAAVLAANAEQYDDALPRLLAVKAPTADDNTVATSIRRPLRDSAALSEASRQLLSAARRGEVAAARQARNRVARASAAVNQAAEGYEQYGSQTCALYLGDNEPSASADGDTLST